MRLLEEGQSAEVEVQWEDQTKINRFSQLSQHISNLEDQVARLKNQKEAWEDARNELDLLLMEDEEGLPVKLGDAFFILDEEKAKEHVESELKEVKQRFKTTEQLRKQKLEQVSTLKKELYKKFGDTINLELEK